VAGVVLVCLSWEEGGTDASDGDLGDLERERERPRPGIGKDKPKRPCSRDEVDEDADETVDVEDCVLGEDKMVLPLVVDVKLAGRTFMSGGGQDMALGLEVMATTENEDKHWNVM